MSHIETNKKDLCTGCGVCKNVCPVKAIHFLEDKEGFLSPTVDEEKCVNCGWCLHYCHLQCNDELVHIKCVDNQYAVKVKDDKIRQHSRSGGVFVELSNEIIRQDGVVYGAIMPDCYHVVHTRAETRDVRDAMCGSKYVQSDTIDIWNAFKDDIKSGRPVLFTGSPCQIAAAARIADKEYNNLYLCDFICHGVPGGGFWRDYLSFMEKKYNRKITFFDFRDKKDHPWGSHVEKLEFDNKIIWSRRYTNIFSSNNCLRRSCFSCPYTVMERVSDFTIGDYWGIDKAAPEFNDSRGISLVLVRGKKGTELFDAIKSKIDFIDTSSVPPEHYNLKRPTAMPDTYYDFWSDYHKYGFEYVSKKYGQYDLARRIKHKIVDKID